nr:MAG: hypothetical protein [Marsupenaeus japonicus endogenous nimavirus]
MVPAHVTEKRLRSMVHIPGNGNDRTINIVFINFSRVSSIAAAAITPITHQKVIPRSSPAPSQINSLTNEAQRNGG